MPPTRRHRPRAQARRDALLRAAVEVAAERGAAGTTHKAVTERAGLPLATVSYFFSSIDDLVAEALRTHVADEAARLEALAERLGGGDDERSADEMAGALSEAAMPDGPLPWTLAQFEAYLQAARDTALGAPVAEALAVYEHVAEVALVAAGAPAEAAAETAPAFNALADGFALHHLARPQADDVDALHRALRLLFLGLLVDRGDLDRAATLAAPSPAPASRTDPTPDGRPGRATPPADRRPGRATPPADRRPERATPPAEARPDDRADFAASTPVRRPSR